MIEVRGALRFEDLRRLTEIVHVVEKVQHASRWHHGLSLSISEAQTIQQLIVQPQGGLMTESTPTQEEIDRFNVARDAFMAAENEHRALYGKLLLTVEQATIDFGNLLVSHAKDPEGTEEFVRNLRLDELERIADDHQRRIARLEEIGGGVVVGPGG